jgi:hypothetical protein
VKIPGSWTRVICPQVICHRIKRSAFWKNNITYTLYIHLRLYVYLAKNYQACQEIGLLTERRRDREGRGREKIPTETIQIVGLSNIGLWNLINMVNKIGKIMNNSIKELEFIEKCNRTGDVAQC